MSEAKYTGPHWNERDRVWFIKFRTPEGARKGKNAPVQFGPDDRVRAVAWADEWIRDQRPPATTIRELTPRWLEYRKANPKVGHRTYVQNESNLRLHVATHAIADMPIPEVSASVLREWVRGLAAKQAPFSVRNSVNSLTAFFEDMLAEDEIELPANPMKHAKVRAVIPEAVTKAGHGVIVHIEQAHLSAFLSCGDPAIPRWRRVKDTLALTSGLRDGELHGLAWSHVRLDAEIPYVQVDRQLATRGENGHASFEDPKKRSFRFLPLHELATTALLWWRAKGWTLWTGTEPQDDSPVFPNSSGDYCRPASPGFLRTDLAIARCPTTFHGAPIDYHATRRSFATYLEGAGVPSGMIAELLGHTAQGTAKRHYIAATMGPRLEAIRRLDLSGISLAWLVTNPGASIPTHSTLPKVPSSQCARTDSNGRHSASKADALSS
jgi:integrase